MAKTNKIQQVLVLTQKSYDDAKENPDELYSKNTLRSFESFVNYEILLLSQQEKDLVSITPLVVNGAVQYNIIYLIDEDDFFF